MASKIAQDSPTWIKIAHNMPPRGSKTAQRRLEVARKLFNDASEKPKSSNLRPCWCDLEGFSGLPWFGPGGVYFGARLGQPSALFGSSSGPGADPERARRDEEARKTPLHFAGIPN